MKYKVHEVAALFPMLQKGSRPYNDLEEHIRLFGQLEPIVVDGNILLDGRNRLAICEDCGITPKIIEWASLGIKNPQHEWIFGKNFARRNLTEEQRGAVFVAYNAWTSMDEARQKKQGSQFKLGNDAKRNTTAGPKKLVDTKPYPPAKRDTKTKNANSTVGKVAAAAGVSHHKAAKLLAIHKAAANGDEKAKEDFEAIEQGRKTLKEIQPKPKKKKLKLSLADQFKKWWPKCLDRFAVADQTQIKQWIKAQL